MTKNKIGFGELIVSCQAGEDEPLRDVYVISALAYAVTTAGIRFIRANGPEDITAIKKRTGANVIGILKDPALQRMGHAFITVRKKDIDAIVRAGADVVAIDCTRRQRPEPLEELFRFVRENYPHVEIVADIADLQDAQNVEHLKPDYFATTLSGYTDYTASRRLPDLQLVSELARFSDIPVIAEGGFMYPWQVREAFLRGACAVVVGSALTRPHLMVRKFLDAFADLKVPGYVFGVDIGGTNVRFALIDRFGNVLERKKEKNPQDPDKLLEAIFTELERVRRTVPVSHIGVASAGRIDPKTGAVSFASDNIKGWTGVELRRYIEERTGLRVFVDNDANAATFAQWWRRPADNIVLLTFGTGVGAGAVIDGRLIRGKIGGALEVGHVIYPGNDLLCTCGKKGCVETYLRGEMLKKLSEEGSEGLERIAGYIAWLLDTVKSILDFEIAYLHGVIKYLGDELLQKTRQRYQQLSSLNTEPVVYSELDDFGGAFGAALLSLFYGGVEFAECNFKD